MNDAKGSFIRTAAVAAMAAACALPGFAKIDLATPFTDNMVLQRGMKVPVWGRDPDPCQDDREVTVAFAGQEKTAKVDGKTGAWRVDLDPMAASKEPRTMTVTLRRGGWLSGSKESVEVKNVLVGEVWFASGQSNMECPIAGDNPRYRDGKGALMTKMIRRPLIRYAHNDRVNVKTPRLDWKGQWFDYSPESFRSRPLSAVAFYFAREIFDAIDVPVGIVDSSWGGSRIEPWTPPDGGMWNGMVAAWAPMAIRGFIWYQGCANAGEGMAYKKRMHALYDGWAKYFENPGLKLYFVELAPFKHSWFNVQQGQAAFAAEEKNAGMVTTCDVGNWDDIHPNDKETVGQRLAALALQRDYGFAGLVADAPTVKSWRVENGRMAIAFNHASGLYVYNDNGGRAQGFEMAGPDGVFHPAQVANKGDGKTLQGAELLLACDKVTQPRRVRYLAQKPYVGALYSADSSLPVGSFEIDASEPMDTRRALPRIGDALKLPELAGFRKVVQQDLPSAGASKDNAFDAAAAGTFSRIAYVLELESPKGFADYAVAVMDAFTTADKLGLPCATKANFQQRVGRLTVRSNLKGINEVTDAEGGVIEFFTSNYGTGCALADVGGDGRKYDFNDQQSAPMENGYGCLQIHDAANKTTVLSVGNFNGTLDIGIGNNADHHGHPDWTFAGNAADFRVRRLTVLVK